MMKAKLTLKIDGILKDYEFRKKNSLWNRDSASFVDVIDCQINKTGDMFTINTGVADKFVTDKCWGIENAGMVDEPSCTIRARLGELAYGRDVWWSLSNDTEINEALGYIRSVAIPFLQHNHSVDHMIKRLEIDLASKHYPPGVIYLALLYYKKGQIDHCRDIFKSMKLSGAWEERASKILASLN